MRTPIINKINLSEFCQLKTRVNLTVVDWHRWPRHVYRYAQSHRRYPPPSLSFTSSMPTLMNQRIDAPLTIIFLSRNHPQLPFNPTPVFWLLTPSWRYQIPSPPAIQPRSSGGWRSGVTNLKRLISGVFYGVRKSYCSKEKKQDWYYENFSNVAVGTKGGVMNRDKIEMSLLSVQCTLS